MPSPANEPVVARRQSARATRLWGPAATRFLMNEAAWEATRADQKPPAGEPRDRLTRREREVALLVGRGLTNRRIALELIISEHTAATHVRRL